jgi:integron integrase
MESKSREEGLGSYGRWLRERRLAPDKHIPHFERWVARFKRFRARGAEGEAWRDSLEGFLEQIEGKAPDWQIRQATLAVTLYCRQFHLERDGREEATATAPSTPPEAAELLVKMQKLLRLRHYAVSTEQAYVGWTRRFFEYLDSQTPLRPTSADARSFLTHLATRQQLAASSQNQAFNALLFLYRYVLGTPFEEMESTVRARRGRHLPVVLTHAEVRALFAQLSGEHRLIVEILYGGGLRIGEVAALRVKDLDLDGRSISVRSGKGDKDRVTILSKRTIPALHRHLAERREQHRRELAAGAGEAPLPHALARKYPNAGREWAWQYLFPSAEITMGRNGKLLRWHRSPSAIQRAVKSAALRAEIPKPVTPHTLRHSFATHLLMQGVDIRRIQSLLGHNRVETTMIYVHVVENMGRHIESPLDRL